MGRYADAAEVFLQLLRRVKGQHHLGGRYHLHFAEALAGAGHPDAAAAALLEALDLELSLADEIRGDPYLEPLREGGRLDALLEKARRAALRRLDED